MEVIGVIPARFRSTRFEGKVLADILGKPMIQHVWERARRAAVLNDLIIACDDKRIAQAAQRFGAKVAMTSAGHVSGTDRISEVVNPLDVKIVVNIQADEPLIHPAMINSVAQALLDDNTLSVATIMKKIEDPQEITNPNVVKVVVDKNNMALYFSRAAIPHHAKNSSVKSPVYYKHVGLYGYTKDYLFIHNSLPVSLLESTEKLEQLRVLEQGLRIKVIETNFETVGVDTPEDLEKAKLYLQKEKV